VADAIIDLEVYRDLQETAGADFVEELVDTFLEEAPGMLAALRAAHMAGNDERFRRAAHSLKSNSLTFGAAALAVQARALELGGAGADAEAALSALDQAYAVARERLLELRRG
jgi:HPt (histidine-containing phosphotransfer) domain-containing protein